MATAFEELIAAIPEEDLAEILDDPIAWAETFLILPTTSEPFRANYVQRQILSSTSRFNAIRIYRRAGKSYSLGILALYNCLTIPSYEVLIIGPDAAKVQEIFTKIRDFVSVNTWIQEYVTNDRLAMPCMLRFANASSIKGITTGARSKGKGVSLRGHGGDLVLVDEADYLNEEDWPAMNPIFQGDRHRREKPRVYVSSTPAFTRGNFYGLFHDKIKKKLWNPIHIGITDDPTATQEFIDECRALCPNELSWISEDLADWPAEGESVFPRYMVERALRDHRYEYAFNAAVEQTNRQELAPTRTMGIDWDKHARDGHGCNICVLEAMDGQHFRSIYREEIPQGEFTLTNARNRVVVLNDIFRPAWIYLDKGCHGEPALEELQLIGKSDPRSGLAEKVIGVQFAETVECPLPRGGVEKRMFKQVMISLLRNWFEREQLELARDDEVLTKQFIDFHVVKQTDRSIKYSGKNDHGIAALGMAAMAMHLRVKNPYTPKAASQTYRLPIPQAVPAEQLPQYAKHRLPGVVGQIYGNGSSRTFSRASLGRSVPGERRNF